KMPVTQTTFTTFCQDFFFAVFGNFKKQFACFFVFYNRSKRYINVTIFTIATGTARTTTVTTVTCFYMSLKTQMMQGPQTFVTTNNYVTATTAITTIGTTFFNEFFTV